MRLAKRQVPCGTGGGRLTGEPVDDLLLGVVLAVMGPRAHLQVHDGSVALHAIVPDDDDVAGHLAVDQHSLAGVHPVTDRELGLDESRECEHSQQKDDDHVHCLSSFRSVW